MSGENCSISERTAYLQRSLIIYVVGLRQFMNFTKSATHASMTRTKLRITIFACQPYNAMINVMLVYLGTLAQFLQRVPASVRQYKLGL